MSSLWSDKYLEESREEIITRILNEVETIADLDSQEWIKTAETHAHRWRFARPRKAPISVDLERISFAGDAWSEPLGTIKAAINSAEWAVAELLFKLQNISPNTVSHQTTLF